MKITKNYLNQEKSKQLHSPNHALADELSVKLNDKRHFGFYLKMAITHNHAVLRRLAGEVLENKSAKNPGALFAYLIKKHNHKDDPTPQTDPKESAKK